MMTYQTANKIRAEFAPETQFTVAPTEATVRSRMELRLDLLKEQLLAEIMLLVRNPERHAILRVAANEAASLAWITPCPLLVLPVLLEEKARAAMEKSARQSLIRQRTQHLATLAA